MAGGGTRRAYKELRSAAGSHEVFNTTDMAGDSTVIQAGVGGYKVKVSLLYIDALSWKEDRTKERKLSDKEKPHKSLGFFFFFGTEERGHPPAPNTPSCQGLGLSKDRMASSGRMSSDQASVEMVLSR